MVIGAGAWGTAIADLLAKNSSEVLLVANNQAVVDEINDHNSNKKFLPNIVLNNRVRAVKGFESDIKKSEIVFIVTPSDAVEEIINKIAALRPSIKISFVICSKGLDHKKLKFFSEIFFENLPLNKLAILSGPNFAAEVASETPSVTTIASISKVYAKTIIDLLNNDFFMAKCSSDMMTVEICGLVKNIIAIGCGIVDGLKLGQNTKAALVNRGIEEIMILCKKMRGSGDLANPAGFGDIFLTCSSSKSRNNSLGVMVAEGESYAKIQKEQNKTFEGAVAAESMVRLAKKLRIELILCQTIAQILESNYSSKQIQSLIIKAIFQNDR